MQKTKYKPLNGYTKQTIIETLLANVPLEGSTKEGACGAAECLYRNEANTGACAVGAFIPDDVYHAGMEGTGVLTLLPVYAYISKTMPLSVEGLDKLQRQHDQAVTGYLGEPLVEVINWVINNVKGESSYDK